MAGRLGLSVANVSVARLFEHFGEEAVCAAMDDWMAFNQLSMFGVTCDVHEGEVGKRFIMMYSQNKDAFGRSLEMLIEKVNADEVVQAVDCVRGSRGDATFVHWQIKNLSLSRKKYEAFLKKIYTK